MNNGQQIRKAFQDAAKEVKKPNPYKHDVITDPEGQWKYPGQITKIPDRNITMKGVPYPVLGVDDLGNTKLMLPGEDYTFPGQTVTEYPMLAAKGAEVVVEDVNIHPGKWLDKYDDFKKGGIKQLKALSRDTTKYNIKTSMNYLMSRNFHIYGLPGTRFYDPNAKKQMGGWLDNYE